jgi:hypothetical protein
MGWKYEPPAPDTEATNMLSAYHERLRRTEARDALDVNRDAKSPASGISSLGRLRNTVSAIFTRLGRARR